ncbi:contact-dependent growth inhibition system immunity protein [Streptomyces boluensis]|uniref:Uncharacterized protein n=1 Tax=Streptomyces boluensis TaxID=1775135 RepID=A0A964UVD7_9ACTN|nr:contact-dependent growth inhibition system immunity protein [Streptomyces boluensis]NBE55070.1 hypothetical protein [Streptomyces boluensis]
MDRLLHHDRTLDELEGAWPDPPDNTTALVKTVHALRRKKLGTLTVEDLQRLVSQSVSLPFLLPLAMEVLRDNPLAEGRYYAGDLLSAVLGCPPSAWALFPDLAEELEGIASQLHDMERYLAADIDRFLATRAT